MNASEAGSSRDPLDLLAEAFLERFRRGERPSLEEYTSAHPELAEDIRDLFPALVEIERMKSLPGSPKIDEPVSRPPFSRLGDYQILGIIGHGGMGIVYEAIRESLRRRVALKVMHPRYRDHGDYLRRFNVEARAAARLHHTNIVSVFDYGEAEGVVYYAMPLIAGHNLEKILDDVRLLRGKSNLAVPTVEKEDVFLAKTSVGERTLSVRARALPEAAAVGLLSGTFAPARTLPISSGDWQAETESPVGIKDETELRPEEPAFASSIEENASSLAEGGPASSSLSNHSEIRYHREIARVGAQVADALAYAHKRGVLHRDIKPSNLLLDVGGNVWVTDFGLAKFEDGEDLSQSRDVVGTMRYMAPERFRGVSDRKCDLYSLGATLYELLALRPAFEAKDQLGLIRQIAQEPVTPLREIDRRIPRDLETIVLKALAKEPKDRFGTADAMAEELRRFVENRPILSRKIPAYERYWRWCKRNPTLSSLNVVAASLVIAIALISSVSASRLKTQRDQANRNLISAYAGHAQASRYSRRVGQRFESLDSIAKAVALAPSVGGLTADERLRLRNETIAALALPDFRVAREIKTADLGIQGSSFAVDHDFRRFAGKRPDGTVIVGNLSDGREIVRMQGTSVEKTANASLFSDDGRYFAMKGSHSGLLEVWEIPSGRLVLKVEGLRPSYVRSYDFHPDGNRLAVGHGDGSIVFYDLPSGRETSRYAQTGRVIEVLAFNADGSRLAIGSFDRQVRVLETASGRVLSDLPHPNGIFHLAWNPLNRDVLATACEDSILYIWDVVTGKQKVALKGETYQGVVIAYHPAGNLLVGRGWKGILRLWDTRTGEELLKRVSLWSAELHFDREGKMLAGEMETETARIFEFAEGDVARILAEEPFDPAADYNAVAIDQERGLAAASGKSGVAIWELSSGNHITTLPISRLVLGLLFDRSGAIVTADPRLIRWPVHERPGSAITIGPPELLLPVGTGQSTSLSSDGQTLTLAMMKFGGLVLDARRPWRHRFLLDRQDVRNVAVSPDGRWVVTDDTSIDGGLRLWEADTGRLVHDFPELPRRFHTVREFSPDGRFLIVNGDDGWFTVDTTTWRLKTRLTRPTAGGIKVSPDSRFAVYSSTIGEIDLVDLETGRLIARLNDRNDSNPGNFAFSEDGSRLMVPVDRRPYVRIWDLRAIRRRLASMGLDWDLPPSWDTSSEELKPRGRHVVVDRGSLEEWLKKPDASDQEYLDRLDRELVAGTPDIAEIQRDRGSILSQRNRPAEAIAAFAEALRAGGDPARLLESRGLAHLTQGEVTEAIADFEEVLRLRAKDKPLAARIALACNNQAWLYVTDPVKPPDPTRAIPLARAALRFTSGKPFYMNTLGVALYRDGRLEEAILVLLESLHGAQGQSDPFDLFFLAMAHQRLGRQAEAKLSFERALQWRRDHPNPPHATWNAELDRFQTEAENLLNMSLPDFPADVFAPSHSSSKGRP